MIDAHELGNIDLVRRLMRASSEYVFSSEMSTFAGGGGAALQGSGAYSQNTGTVSFVNSNNITFGLSTNQMTASFEITAPYLTTAMASDAGSLYQSAGAYLTTAMASDAGSLYQSAGAYLTTAAASDHGHTDKAGVGTSLTSTGGVDMVFTLNSDGLSLNIPKWITTYAAGGGQIDISAGASSDSLASLVLSNSYNISFGLAGSTITASANAAASDHTHSDLYQSTGAYLTTAMASDAGSLYQSAGAYLTTAMASDAGSLYQSAGAYLTTAAASDHAHSDLQSAGAYLTTAMASDAGSLYQSAGAYLTTAMASDAGSLYQSAGAYLTTAAVSDHTHSDLYQSTGAYLTTAALSNHAHSDLYIPLAGSSAYQTATLASTFVKTADSSLFQHTSATSAVTSAAFPSANTTKFIGSGTTIATTSGVILKVTANSDGLNISYPAAITTAALSNHTHSDIYEPLGKTHSDLYPPIAGTTAYNYTVLSNSLQITGAYLTTAAISDHTHSNKAGVGTTIGATNGTLLKITLNSDGLNMSVPAYITTYAAGGGEIDISAGASSDSLASLVFSNSNNVSFGLGGSTITASVNAAVSNHTHSDIYEPLGKTHSDLYQITGAYLTTAAQSGHTHSDIYEPLGKTHSDLYQPIGAYLTTAAASGHTHSDIYEPVGKTHSDLYPPIAGTTAYNYTVLSNSLQITGAYLTTAAASGHTHSDIYEPLGKTHSDLYQPIGAYLTTAMASDAGSLYQSVGAYLTTAAVSDHTHSDLYQSTGAYLTTAAQSGHTHSDVYEPLGKTHSDLYIPLAGSSAYQTATLKSTFMELSQSSQFQTATLAGTFMDKSYSSAFQTATLAGTFMDKSYSSGFQTATLAGTFMDKSYSSAFQTATLAGTFMDKSYSSAFQTATLAGTFAQISNKAGIGTTVGATNGTLIKVTLNTDGLNISMPAYITTYTPGVGGGDWTVATVGGTDLAVTTGAATNTIYYPKWIITAAASDHTHSDLYLPIGNSTQWATGTLSSALMPLSYSSGFQTATLAGTFMDKSYSSAFQTATLAGTFMDKSYSSAFQTATLAGTFMDKSYSSAFQTATLAGTFMDKSYSSGFQTATLAGTFMDKSYSSGFQTATLAGTFAQISNKAGIGTTIGATNGTLLKITVNSDGVNMSVPAYITTYVAGAGIAVQATDATYSSGTVIFRGTNITVNTSAGAQYVDLSGPAAGRVYYSDGSGLVWGSAVNGVSTTITASVTGGAGGVAVKASGTYSQNTGTVEFANSNRVTFGLSDNGTLTASINAIATATTIATTSGDVLKITADSAGLNISHPKFITTYAGTVTGATGCNVTVNTSGVSVSVVAATGTVYFVNSNAASWGSSTGASVTSYWIVTA